MVEFFRVQIGYKDAQDASVCMVERRYLTRDDLHDFVDRGLSNPACQLAQISRDEPQAAINRVGNVLAYQSGDRCHRCGGKAFSVGRIVAECGHCGYAVPLTSANF